MTHFCLHNVCTVCIGNCFTGPCVLNWQIFILYTLLAALCTSNLTSQKFHVQATQCIYVFCVDLRTNSDYFVM